jgi:hypothetical protein
MKKTSSDLTNSLPSGLERRSHFVPIRIIDTFLSTQYGLISGTHYKEKKQTKGENKKKSLTNKKSNNKKK